MPEHANLPLEALRRIQDKRTTARDDLENALLGTWNEFGNPTSEEHQREGQRHVMQLLGAYARKIFDIEAEEYVDLNFEPAVLSRRFDQLAASVQAHMIPPQFRIQSAFYLRNLYYDATYRSHIGAVVEDRVHFWKKSHIDETGGSDHPSPGNILDQYCERQKLTLRELAVKANVDVSVIYAIKARRKKCGRDVLTRIARLVGCEPNQLAPKE